MLWVKGHAFESAYLPIPQAAHLEPPLLTSLVTLAGAPEDANHTVSNSWWIKVAHDVLKIKPKFAQLLLQLFHESFYDGGIADDPVECNINICDFVIFLYVLNSFKETSEVAIDTPWPAELPNAGSSGGSPVAPNTSSPVSPRASMGLASKALDEGKQMKFVKNHISNLLHVIVGTQAATAVVSAQKFDRLGLLLGGGPNQHNQVTRLSSLVPVWAEEDHAVAPVAQLAEWVVSNLGRNTVLNPSVAQVSRPPKALEDTEMGSPSCEAVPRLLVLASQHKVTLVKSGTDVLESADEADGDTATRHLRITNCSDSFIYILGPFRSVTVVGCINCTVVLGAVARTAFIQSCERLRLSVAARRIRINSCVDSTLYLWTATPPLYLGDNHGIVLAPHNLHYHKLGQLIHQAGLTPSATLNQWDVPISISRFEEEALTGDQVAGQSLMPPQSFFPMAVPVEPPAHGDTPGPCPPPPRYAQALEQKHRAVVVLREKIRALDGSADENKKELKAAIHLRFKVDSFMLNP